MKTVLLRSEADLCRGKAEGKKCVGGSVDADGSPVCAGAKCTTAEFAMKTVLAALSGRLVPWVKLKAKSAVTNLWMQMGAQCAQVQNAPLLSLQMKVVCCAPRQTLLRGKLKANMWRRISRCRWESLCAGIKCTDAEFANVSSVALPGRPVPRGS